MIFGPRFCVREEKLRTTLSSNLEKLVLQNFVIIFPFMYACRIYNSIFAEVNIFLMTWLSFCNFFITPYRKTYFTPDFGKSKLTRAA